MEENEVNMSVAIHTVRSLTELRAIKQPHPLRSVTDGDYVQLIGDRFRDDCAFFKSSILGSPVESLPSSIVSDDNRIQWNKKSHGFFDGNVPNSLSLTGKFSGTVPDGWATSPGDAASYEVSYLQEYFSSTGHSCEHVNGIIWITSENIIKLDLSNLNSTVYSVGTMTDGTSSLGIHGRCYSKSEDVIHIIDTAGNHHLFDTATQTMSYAAKAAYPVTMNQNYMIDASSEAGKLYYINRHSSLAYDIYEYDISGNSWTLRATCPTIPVSWGVDPYNPGKFLICLYNNGVYTLDSSDGSFTIKHTITGSGTITTPYTYPAALIWDSLSGKYYSPDYFNFVYYDPLTGDSGSDYDVDIIGRSMGSSMSVYMDEGINFFLDEDEYNAYRLVSTRPYDIIQKERP